MKDAHLGEVAEAAIKVEAVTNYEFIGDIKANEFALGSHGAWNGLAEKYCGGESCRMLRLKLLAQEVQRASGIQHVIND